MPHDPYTVTPRSRLSDKERLQLFVRHNGVCCICGGKIDAVRERWIDEHISPLWRDGTNESDNRAPAHEKCARAKTSAEATARAKGRSVAEKHFGAKKKSGFRKPPPGMKKDWKTGRLVKIDDET